MFFHTSKSTVLVSRVGDLQLCERLLLVGMLHQKVGAAVCSSHLQGCVTLGSCPRAGCPLFFFFSHPHENQNEISSLKIWFWKERLISCRDNFTECMSKDTQTCKLLGVGQHPELTRTCLYSCYSSSWESFSTYCHNSEYCFTASWNNLLDHITRKGCFFHQITLQF